MLTPTQVAKIAVEALEEKSGRDIKVLKTEDLTVLANYFVISTATSTTHIKTLADALEKHLGDKGEVTRRKEGYRSGG